MTTGKVILIIVAFSIVEQILWGLFALIVYLYYKIKKN